MASCPHLEAAPTPGPPAERVCEECVKSGGTWVHLRQCQECGHVGCCDASPGKHATEHFQQSDHPVMRSAEPGEDWRYCFVDEVVG